MKMFKLAIAAVFAVMVSGCAFLETETGTFTLQYATLSVIDKSDDVSAEDVLETTAKVRKILDENSDLSLATLSANFRERVDVASLDPSDQVLVTALIDGIEARIAEQVGDTASPFTVDQKTTVLDLLDAIEEAAAMYL